MASYRWQVRREGEHVCAWSADKENGKRSNKREGKLTVILEDVFSCPYLLKESGLY